MGLLSAMAPAAQKLTSVDWWGRDPAWRAAHPEMAPEGEATGGLLGSGTGRQDSPGSRVDFNAKDFARDGKAAMSMMPGLGLMARGGMVALGLEDPLASWAGAPVTGGAINKGGIADDLAAFGGEPSAATSPGGGYGTGGMADDLGAFGGNDPEGYAGGSRGPIKASGLLGPNPPGPDDGYAALKVGERVLNEKQFGRLSPSAQKEVDGVLKAKKK